MANRNRLYASEFLYVAVAQFAMLIGGLATIKLLSNILDIHEFGVFSLLFSVASLVVAAIFSPVGQINMRFVVLEKKNANLRAFYSRQKTLLIWCAAISIVVAAVWAFIVPSGQSTKISTFAALLMLTLAMGFQTPQQYELMAFRMRKEGSLVQLIGAIARPFFAFLAMLAVGYNAVSATFGLGLGFLVLCSSQYFYLRKTREKNFLKQETAVPEKDNAVSMKSYLSYATFFALQGAVSAVILNSDRWVLGAFGTLKQVAILAALMQIALVGISFSFALLTRFAAPIYFGTSDKSQDIQDQHLRHLMIAWCILCGAILVFCFLFHNQLVTLATNEVFARYSYLLPWMVIGLTFERTAQLLELQGGLKLATNYYIAPKFAIIILIPLAEYVFFRLYGFEGIIIGLIIASFTSLVVTVMVNRIFVQQK